MEHKPFAVIAPVGVAAILILGILSGISSTAGKTVKTPYVSKTVKTTFTAKLTGNNEVPFVNTPATGIARFELSSDGKVLNYHLSTTNLKGFKEAAICEKEPVFSQGKTGETCGSVAQLSIGKGKITWQDLMGSLEDSPVSYLVKDMRSGKTMSIFTHRKIRGHMAKSADKYHRNARPAETGPQGQGQVVHYTTLTCDGVESV